MNKDRLNLCSSFTQAETLEQKKKRENKEYWERQVRNDLGRCFYC